MPAPAETQLRANAAVDHSTFLGNKAPLDTAHPQSSNRGCPVPRVRPCPNPAVQRGARSAKYHGSAGLQPTTATACTRPSTAACDAMRPAATRPPQTFQAARVLCGPVQGRSFRGSTWAPVERAETRLTGTTGPPPRPAVGCFLDVPDTVYLYTVASPNLVVLNPTGNSLSYRCGTPAACYRAAGRTEKALSGR